MNRVSKLSARIESLRAEESAIKIKHAEALVALADDHTGLDIDRRAVKRLGDQLAGIRAEIDGLAVALEKAAELDEQDAQREAGLARLAEFRAFEDSLQPRMEATKAFEKALQALIATIREVQAADAAVPASLRQETPWKHAIADALVGVLGRGDKLPRPGASPNRRYNRHEARPCSSFIEREHQASAYRIASELHFAGLLDSAPPLPEHMRESTEPTKPQPPRPETFGGTFIEQGDGFFVREGDGRVFQKTEFGFIVALAHPGYINRRPGLSYRELT